jgi:hypothetical protein
VSNYLLISFLTSRLFEAEGRRLESELQRINTLNKSALQTVYDGFLFLGRFYRPTTGTVTIGSKDTRKNSLDFSLHAEMEEHVKDCASVAEEKKLIEQTLSALLNSCHGDAMVRNALPECLVNCLSYLSAHNRTREPAYTIQDNPRALRQYLKILPKIEIYSVTQMLY